MSTQTQSDAATEARALTGRVAVVTGAAKGLGAAITDLLARQGADVVFAGRDREALQAHASSVDAQYPYRRSLAAPCDVTDEPDVRRMVSETLDQFGGIDILVNAHGIIGPIETPAQDVTPDDFRHVLEVNVVGVHIVCRAVIPHRIERGG